jgi:hypothetical protein
MKKTVLLLVILLSLSGCSASPNGPIEQSPQAVDETTGDAQQHTTTEFQVNADGKADGEKNESLFNVTSVNFSTTTDYEGPLPQNLNHSSSINFTEQNIVLIKGKFPSGERSCRTTKLEQVYFNPESDVLSIVVFDDYHPPTRERPCTLEEVLVSYEIKISYSGNTPEYVFIEHTSEKTVFENRHQEKEE